MFLKKGKHSLDIYAQSGYYSFQYCHKSSGAMMEKKGGELWSLSEEEHKRLISRDHDAWQRFVESKTPLLINYIQWKFRCSDDSAEEITQKVFIEVLIWLPTLEQPSKFKGWILQVAFRTAYKEIFPHYKVLPPERQPVPEPWEVMQAQDLRVWIAMHLNLLTPEQLPLFILHFYDNLSASDISVLLGKTIGLVSVQIFKACKRLREIYEKEHS